MTLYTWLNCLIFFLSVHLQLHQEVLGKGKHLPLLDLVGGGGWGDGGMGSRDDGGELRWWRDGGTQSTSFFLNAQQRSAKLPRRLGISFFPKSPVSLLYCPLTPDRGPREGPGWRGQAPLSNLLVPPQSLCWPTVGGLFSFCLACLLVPFYKENIFLKWWNQTSYLTALTQSQLGRKPNPGP